MQFIPIKHTISFSIFDIPLILDLICDNLTKVDLLPCLQVSRDWFDIFQPQVLRHVEFVNLKKHQTWALLDSAARIQTLSIDISDGDWLLNNPTSPCINLIELHCLDYDYLPKGKDYWGLLPAIVDQTRNALLLVETNPKLRTLFVEHYEWRYKSDHFTEPVFESLATHTSLTRIHISVQSITLPFRYSLYNSLPVSLRELEFCYRNLYSPWDESVDTTPEPKLTTTLLPALERLCLSGPQKRVTSHWQEEVFIPSPFSPARPAVHANYCDPEVATLIKRVPQLRDFVLRDHYGMLQDVLQLLVTSCPDVETIDISIDEAVPEEGDIFEMTTATTSPLSPESRFDKLKEFRIEGEWSSSTHLAMAELVSRSTDTLEIAWLDRNSRLPIMDTANPFHIGTEASWTRCTQLKELVLYQGRGFSMSDYCWNAPAHSRTIPDAVEDYTTVFSRLEKLRLSVMEPLWQECPDGHHTGIPFQAEGEWSAVEFEFDDGWNPIIRDVSARTPEDDIHDQELKQATKRKEWEHRLAFILHVRELYGRLKDLKQLRALEIEWCACSSIRDMTLDVALQLFYETEFDEDDARGINFKRREDLTRTSKGWWGPIITADLSWLGLSWPTQAELEAESNVQQLASIALKNSEVEPNTSYARLADPFRRHVGRVWEDWMYLVGSCPHHWSDRVRNGDRVGYCTCRSQTDFLDAAIDGYEVLDSDHVVNHFQAYPSNPQSSLSTTQETLKPAMSFFKRSNKNKTSSAASTPAQTPRASLQTIRDTTGTKMTPEEALYKISHNMMSNAANGPFIR
ncbi:hypothetical protein EC957_004187 [Mortierella hygrophila]|uniref:F-box domain-containing protein n=1 Tax=Mortierella hygrophila TaxID=979708 RepID=A0A9P6FI79_9FUNG|nr:hypothetical protein EC957_004187 [Mortierella hygrophila]